MFLLQENNPFALLDIFIIIMKESIIMKFMIIHLFFILKYYFLY